MDSRKSELGIFFKPPQLDAGKINATEYFKKCLSREELNKLFPGKVINYVQINFIPNHAYQKGDVLSNMDGMTMMSLEFSDGTKESIRWKEPKPESVSSIKPSTKDD